MEIEQYAQKHHHYWSTSFDNKELQSVLNTKRFTRVIDVGCGDGILLYHLNCLEYLKSVEEFWAVDLSETRLDSVSRISDRIKIMQADAQHLIGVPDSYFDLVISTQVIEHVQNDSEMLLSLSRIARPGAVIYLDTVFKERYGYYFYRNKRGERVLDPTHEREYTDTSDLLPKIHAAGFEITNSVMTPFRFSPLNFLLRLMKVKNERVSCNFVLRNLQRFKIPIIGYKCWKLILRKPL